MKPHIRRSKLGNHWLCYGDGCLGYGITPALAYHSWRYRWIVLD